jgi:hypothetical protein
MDILGVTAGIAVGSSGPSMARLIRIHYPGTVYHELAGSSHGQEFFQDDQDRQRLPETLGEAGVKTSSGPFMGSLWL